MKKNTILIVLAAVVLSAFLSITAKTGTDDKAVNLISDITSGNYKPWTRPLWTPPESWMETLLFSIQAGIGAFVFGYAFHLIREHSKGERQDEHSSNP